MAKAKKAAKAKVETVEDAICKRFGDGAVMKLGSKRGRAGSVSSVVPTGSIGLDLALGVGGLPRGRIVEVWGGESAGKTSLALHVIAEAQGLGLKCGIVDAEHALDPKYATAIGVDPGLLYVSQPENGEEGLGIVEMMAASGDYGVIVVDSVAALTPKAEIDGAIGDIHMGLHARLMSQAMRKLAGVVSKSNTLVMFINQTRSRMNVMFGSGMTTTGGNALKFYASVRMSVSRPGYVEESNERVGIVTRVKVVKNKVAPPFKEAEFHISHGRGIDKAAELLAFAVDLGFVDKAGAWYSYDGKRLAQGRSNAVAAVRESSLGAELRDKVLGHFAKEA